MVWLNGSLLTAAVMPSVFYILSNQAFVVLSILQNSATNLRFRANGM